MAATPFITRWDLDKTYLRTEFDTLSDLVRTAFEPAREKRAVPGAAALLRALGDSGARVHILSGSPKQLRARLEEKLRLDRVRWDDLTLKPNLGNLLRLRFRALRDQLGFKLPALLAARVRDQGPSRGAELPCEVLVGDDAEADAFVYSLYADVCSGIVDAGRLESILREGRVYPDQRELCLSAHRDLVHGPIVERILIHLDRQSPPSHFDAYGPRVVPFYNYLQAALVLAEDGRLTGRAVLGVAGALTLRHRFDAEALGRSYLDLLRRGQARGTVLPLLEEGIGTIGEGELKPAGPVLEEMVRLIGGYLRSPPPVRPPTGATLDYMDLASRHRFRAHPA